MKIAVIAVASRSGETGGAERLYQGLTASLRQAGMQADLIECVSDESGFDAIKETYLRFYDLDVSAYDGVISTKAPSYLVRHENHVCWLVHTMRVFYDMFETEFPGPSRELLEQKSFIQTLDSAALAPNRVRKIFTIGREITGRLLEYNGLSSEVLHPALLFDNFQTGNYEDYLFIPGRLHRWKRVHLLIQAMGHVESPVRLKIAGVGEDEAALKRLAGQDPRIEFLGRITDAELISLYANALAVPFVPLREDYGYVTLEAFRSNKPVLTCKDSGEPAHFVKDGDTGFVCEPEPRELAARIDYLHKHGNEAAAMGRRGNASIAHITWERIADKMLRALGQKNVV